MALAFSPKKSLGQHFLRDPNTARKIVDALQDRASAPVVEIGPGMGALTGLLLERFSRVTALEIDKRAVVYLQDIYPDLEVRHQDVLVTNWSLLAQEKGQRLSVIGNLPYNITSLILFGLLEHRQVLSEAILLMQREVAERIVAQPGRRTYGIPSVLTQIYASPKLLFRVSPRVFYPQPAVESAVVRLVFNHTAPEVPVEQSFLTTVVRTAFNQRRKMLRNSLGAWNRDLPRDWGHRRAEELSPALFVELACFLRKPAYSS